MAADRTKVINRFVEHIEEEIHELYDEKHGKPCFYSVEFNILSFFFSGCLEALIIRGFSLKEAKEMTNEIMEKIYALENYHKECEYGFKCLQCPIGGITGL